MQNLRGANEHATRKLVVTTAHGHSQLQRSYQCIVGFLGRNRTSGWVGSDLMERKRVGTMEVEWVTNFLTHWTKRWPSEGRGPLTAVAIDAITTSGTGGLTRFTGHGANRLVRLKLKTHCSPLMARIDHRTFRSEDDALSHCATTAPER
ncbi:hypothetical protein EVAR_85831_1 [Eumeta japonica]|uniref:Uncharacterized protein n=1 Tax=Eumeta variegata TaxID=151549 RepID=A0A4C1URN2_EUMVA|nr:hypothetical protein EVAR_85831_1 [Eumeta japonica]